MALNAAKVKLCKYSYQPALQSGVFLPQRGLALGGGGIALWTTVAFTPNGADWRRSSLIGGPAATHTGLDCHGVFAEIPGTKDHENGGKVPLRFMLRPMLGPLAAALPQSTVANRHRP